VPVPQAYIMFEASQYDSYGYLFTKPTFISLDPAAQPGSIDIKGIRIGVNGSEAKVGQTYIPLNATVGGANYTAASGQLLSSVGAVVGLEKGPLADEFFLSFEQIGTNSHPVTEPSVTAAAVTPPPPAPDYGVRTFDELNASMSSITGVPIVNTVVAATFAKVKQQMPSVEAIDAFLASHQTGVAQLAIAYCSAMVDDPTLRNAFFPGFNPNQPGNIFASASNRDPLIAAIGDKIVGDLNTQPSQTEIYNELTDLLTKISTGSVATKPNGAGIGAKAACAAVLGSAAITVQ
jgi:hypothetical protein